MINKKYSFSWQLSNWMRHHWKKQYFLLDAGLLILFGLLVWKALPVQHATASANATATVPWTTITLYNPNFTTYIDVTLLIYPRKVNGESPALKTYANLQPREHIPVGIIDTSAFNYVVKGTNTSTNEKNGQRSWFALLMLLLPALIPGLITLIAARYVVAYLEKMKQEDLHIRESTLLQKELKNIIRHLVKNAQTLDAIKGKKAIPATLVYDKMKIDDTALTLSVETARVLRQHEKLDKFLTARLRLRNLNMELHHIIKYMERPRHTYEVYCQFRGLLEHKLQHALRGVEDAMIWLMGKEEGTTEERAAFIKDLKENIGQPSKIVDENPKDVDYPDFK